MAKLVIVESPAKAKTIKKYLGGDYEVVASMGHVRDLPKSKIGVDIENNFTPVYQIMVGKEDAIKKLKTLAAKSSIVYLATDPDREGEAISWHLCEILALNQNDNNRVTFNEITKTGVKSGIDNPRMIDMDLVDAQQARRVLDRIVGYKLSPFLWKKVRRGLSAGRVQSVTVKIIVDREIEIRAFISKEYWSIDAKLQNGKSSKFDAHFHSKADGKKLEIENEASVNEIVTALMGADYIVKSVKKGVRNKQPSPPFITSTLQQEASRKLNYSSQRTMKIAQELYEGVDVKNIGSTGLITYMRTDSLRISDEARAEGKDFILNKYGEKYLPAQDRFYKQKKNAQDGHEAIRPAIPSLTPESVRDSLTPDQYKVYKLVWERFIASLMAVCVQDTVSADISAGDYIFKASGYNVKFDGFTVLYEEGKDEENEDEGSLPILAVGDKLTLKELTPNQHFTQPPPRYTEASLIKALEEYGIGRPSTYAPTISTVIAREYVERDKKQLVPTSLGEVTTELMKEFFKAIVDVKFTANVEDELDLVEEGKTNWIDVLKKFYEGFDKTLKDAEAKMDGTRVKLPVVESDVDCDLCGRKMVIKSGRFGKFLACPGYPDCKNTKPIVQETEGFCPKCGKKMVLRKSKNKKIYYGCEGGKECGFMTWDEPLKDLCPTCGKTLFKKRGGIIGCESETCDYEIKVEKKTKKSKAEDSNDKD